MKYSRIHDYTDEAGNVIYQKLRVADEDVEANGKFRRRRPDGNGGTIPNWDGLKLVPYRLHKLVNCHDSVCLTAGERDSDTLEKIGFTATTDPGSESAELLNILEFMDSTVKGVYVFADQDDVGKKCAEKRAQNLYGKVPFVKIINVPNGKDISEYLQGMRPKDAAKAIMDLCESTAEWKPEQTECSGTEKGNGTDLSTNVPVFRVETGEGKKRKKFGMEDPEPWPNAVDGVLLLNEIETTVKRHVILPTNGAVVITLWSVLTYVYDAFPVLPNLIFLSPEKRCGKTRAMDTTGKLSRRSLPVSSISAAALFRVIEDFAPTLTIDEADSFLTDNEELRNVLNSSHYKNYAFVVRCYGNKQEPRLFKTWAPKAIATIGSIHGTITDRSITIRMQRKASTQKVERFTFQSEQVFEVLKKKLMRWAGDNFMHLVGVDPEVPEALDDRQADNWRPLLAIANRIGGNWPLKTRDAALAICEVSREEDNSIRIQLLSDLRALFKDVGTDRLSSISICESLSKMEDRPWPEWKAGKPITPVQLARQLREFQIVPKKIRIGEETSQGYLKEYFDDAFIRYLPTTKTEQQNILTRNPVLFEENRPGTGWNTEDLEELGHA